MTTATLAVDVLSATRAAVGVATWLAPGASWRTFGLGRLDAAGTAAPSAGVISRLFGVRDIALGLGLRHPDPQIRRVILRVGIAIDVVDTVASLLGVRAGAPKASLVGVAAGAALLGALGAIALAVEDD